MQLLLILILSLSFAKSDGERTASEKECVKNVRDKNAIIKKSQCKFEVTTQVYPENDTLASTCNGYYEDEETKKKIPKKTTYNGGGHEGTLVCNNSDNGAIASSYKDQMPVFTFQCSRCSTSSEATTPDAMCLETMLREEEAYCDGSPKMRYKYEPKQDPVLIDTQTGKPLR